jgi:hypothetical protein
MPKQKRRPERNRPGLKQQTPSERKRIEEIVAGHRKMWQALLAVNAWKVIK